MATTPTATAPALAQLANQLGLELAFVEPGKDIGLLPINSFTMEMEGLLALPDAPALLREAVAVARRWMDDLLSSTATFDESSIRRFGIWQAWMLAAAERWKSAASLPELPVQWDQAAAAGPSVTAVALTPAVNVSPDDEPSVILDVDSDRELMAEFINEFEEHLQNIEQGVLVLEKDPADADTLNSIFRAFHTFKGGSGFLNLTAIKDLAHELESLLDAARQHKLEIRSEIIDLILEGGDTLRKFVAQIKTQLSGQNFGQPIMVPTRGIIRHVQEILDDTDGTPMCEVSAAPVPAPAAAGAAMPAAAPAPVVEAAAKVAATSEAAPAASVEKPVSAERTKTGVVVAGGGSGGLVKVDTLKLDSLVDLVGELVIAESMVVQNPEVRALTSQHLSRDLSQLRRITADLQRTAMSLRMVPIRATFQKMIRLVRDLSARQHKQIELVLSGEDTELDRNIVEEISDPLVHMIRNGADHGIETPAARTARGKPPGGTIHLRAFHKSGNIVIQIQDDGNGLNRDRILAKAWERGLLKPGETPGEREIYDLIFAPGFSTAETVSDISGRGVGMDVVRRNIEKLRGKVDISSVAGQGTTFTIYLPLTLAIIDGIIVTVGAERYILPTLSVRESFRPRPGMVTSVHGRGEMVNVRGRLSPLLRLYEYFQLKTSVTNPEDAIVVVVESGQQTRCLMVDELVGKQEVVIKSLGESLRTNRALTGGAILGDGRVGLILDVDSLVKLNGTHA